MSEEEYSSEEEVTEDEEEEEEEEEEEAPKEDPAVAAKKAEEEKKRKAEEDRKAAEARRAAEASKAAEEAGRSKEEEARLKEEEKDRKRAEVRAKLEAQSSKKEKGGFLTGARKKKLKAFLRKKIREDIEAEQIRQNEQRNKILNERIKPISVDGKNETQLKSLIEELYQRIDEIEGQRYEIQCAIYAGDKQINDLTITVNRLRGKFVKPILKKVSKYGNKFAKMQTESKAIDWRANLKPTGDSKYKVDSDESADKVKPEWADKKGAAAAAAAAAAAPKQG